MPIRSPARFNPRWRYLGAENWRDLMCCQRPKRSERRLPRLHIVGRRESAYKGAFDRGSLHEKLFCESLYRSVDLRDPRSNRVLRSGTVTLSN
jgi:hypothetical protein